MSLHRGAEILPRLHVLLTRPFEATGVVVLTRRGAALRNKADAVGAVETKSIACGDASEMLEARKKGITV